MVLAGHVMPGAARAHRRARSGGLLIAGVLALGVLGVVAQEEWTIKFGGGSGSVRQSTLQRQSMQRSYSESASRQSGTTSARKSASAGDRGSGGTTERRRSSAGQRCTSQGAGERRAYSDPGSSVRHADRRRKDYTPDRC